jgi:polysaccharide pyruvyl transferase WcaK-like protein
MQTSFEAPSLAQRLARLTLNPMRLSVSLRSRAIHALLKRMPAAAVGLGVGPFAAAAAQDEANVTELLSRMKFIWVRDPASADFCRERGLEQYIESADLCFSSQFLARFGSGPAHERSRGTIIGVVLSDHPALDDAFLHKIRSVAEVLRAERIQVRFFSFSKRRDHFISTLRSFGETVWCWDPEIMPIKLFRTFLAEHDAILTSRFHAGIFSVINQTPFAVIGVNEKLRLLAQRFRAADVPLLATTDDADRFAGAARALLERPAERRRALSRAFEVETKIAARGEAALAAFLSSAASGEVAA